MYLKLKELEICLYNWGMAVIFDFVDYKKYLRKKLQNRLELGERGPRSRLAEAIQCKSAYLTRVLESDVDLSLEQADRANRFFLHSEEESEWMFLLVHRSRAGSVELKNYFQKKLNDLKQARLNLSQRLKVKNSLTQADQTLYFNRWQNAAIHVATLIPSLQNKDLLAKRLGIPIQDVHESLEFLKSLGLLQEVKGQLLAGPARLHLGKDSPMISRHHTNWRLHALRRLETFPTQGLHYSSVVSISHDDIAQLKELLVRAIENAKGVIRESKEETLAGFCLDFYEF